MLPGGALSLQYQVKSWSLNTDPVHVMASTGPGVFCPAHERKFLPKLPNQFSLTMETVIEVSLQLVVCVAYDAMADKLFIPSLKKNVEECNIV